MIPYYLLIALPVLVQLIGKKYRFTFGKRLLYTTRAASIDVFMIIFFLLLALRGLDCGNDTIQYQSLFLEYSSQRIPQLLTNYSYEWGYKVLNRCLAIVGGEYQMLLAITSLICVYPLWYFYKRESENQLLTIALFLTVAPFVLYFSGIRQAVTVSFGIPAWYCAKKKKLGKFILVVLLALQFHTSAFMLLILYPLYHARITVRWLWAVVPCMALVYIFKTPIFNFLIIFLWKDYATTEETGAITVLILLALFGIYAYIIPDEKKMDQDTVALRNFLIFSIMFQFFATLHPLAMRINYYLLIFIPVLIPKIANRSKLSFRQIANLSMVVMTAYFLYYFLINGINDNDPLNIFPYIPFWK